MHNPQANDRDRVAVAANQSIPNSTMSDWGVSMAEAQARYGRYLPPDAPTTTACRWCQETIGRGVQPSAKLRAVFASLRDDDVFCDADCAMEYVQEHVADIVRHLEAGRVEALL